MTGPTSQSVLRSFELLSEFSDESIHALAMASELKNWAAQDTILKQGQANEHLYILVFGQVGVFVDGGLVSTLGSAGDLLGEMSVINGQPCGATIIANKPSQAVIVNVKQLAESTVLYKIYAKVLSQKLQQTNQKAKYFEELQKLKDQEDSQTHNQLLRRVSDFYRNEKNPTLNSTLEILESIAKLYSTTEAIQRKRVLISESSKKQQLVAKMALGGTGVDLEIVSSLEEAMEKMALGKFDLALVDSVQTDLVNHLLEKSPATSVVLMTSDKIPTYLPNLKKLKRMPHIVSRDEGDRTFSIKNIMTTVTKLLNQDLFGLEKYLSWGVEVQSHRVESSKQRPELIAHIDTHLDKLGVRKSHRDRMHLVAEELLMNAIYDAPVDSSGKAEFNHLHRSQEVILKPEQQGLLRYACDGMIVAISVQDPFGALKGETMLRYLDNCYGENTQDLNQAEGKGGAGRGLHIIVESSDLVVFNLYPGHKTEVIALFNLEAKETAHLNPSFHLFIQA